YNKVFEVLPNGTFRGNRQTISLFKFLKKHLPHHDDEKVTNLGHMMTAHMLDYTVEIVKGEDIAEIYSTLDTSDWVRRSCMSKAPREWFKLYADNPDVCQLGL